MKYSDRFFEFPVRVYENTADVDDDAEDIALPGAERAWRAGKTSIHHGQITVWSDYFDKEQGIEGVDEDGFIATVVWTKADGVFICTLPKHLFEKRLNKHAEEYEKWEDEKFEKSLQEAAERFGDRTQQL